VHKSVSEVEGRQRGRKREDSTILGDNPILVDPSAAPPTIQLRSCIWFAPLDAPALVLLIGV
jgi:hypothetical protein